MMNDNDTILKVTGIKKFYGSKQILNVDQISLKKNTITSLTGLNGTGKTTLLKILALIEDAQTSEFWFDNKKLKAGSKVSYRKRCGFVWQKPLMYNMSVFENVALPLRFREIDSDTICTKTSSQLEALKITHLANQNATSLSGGEQQRASIARALIVEPEILFVDEPVTSLDIDGIKLFEELITEHSKNKAAVLIVTHNTYQAQKLSDRILLLHNGNVQQVANCSDNELLRYI